MTHPTTQFGVTDKTIELSKKAMAKIEEGYSICSACVAVGISTKAFDNYCRKFKLKTKVKMMTLKKNKTPWRNYKL